MSEYSTLSAKDITSIIGDYDIGHLISYEILSGGFQNTNYELLTSSGKFVLTICEEKSVQDTTNLACLLEHLALNNFITSTNIRNNQHRPVGFWKGKPLMLKTYLEGHIIEDLPGHLIEHVGTELGKLHCIEPPDYLPGVLVYGREKFDEVTTYAPNSPYYSWLKEIDTYLEYHIPPDLPKALIHSDVFCSNIIVSEDKDSVIIMDFEEAAYYYRVFDIGMTIVGLCRNKQGIDLVKAKAFLKGYSKEVHLLEIEKKALQSFTVYAAAAMSFWRHKHFNFSYPDPAYKDHYLELKHIADHVRSLPASVFH